MLVPQVKQDGLLFGESLHVQFARTLRISDQAEDDTVPSDYGLFQVFCATDYVKSAPAAWAARPTVFIAVHSHEAVRMRFSSPGHAPAAVKVGMCGTNVLTGAPWHERLLSQPQDYLVCPDQARLDGYVTSAGVVRQFTAMSLNSVHITGRHPTAQIECSQIRLMVFGPRASQSTQLLAPRASATTNDDTLLQHSHAGQATMLAERQAVSIQPDRYGMHTWDSLNYGCVWVHLVTALTFLQITGREAPHSPVDVKQYHRTPMARTAPWGDRPVFETADLAGKTRYQPWIRRPR